VVNYTSDSSKAKAQAVASELESTYGVTAIVAQADLSTTWGPRQLIETAKSALQTAEGRFQIDIIVNNAGVTNPEALEALTASAYDGAFDLNARGPALLVSAAVPYLPTDRSGRIVNISSIGASVGLQYSTAYAGSKGALEAMTRVWARELAERATVNSVSVGPMAGTGLYDCIPSDMAHVVFPLLSNAPLSKVRPGVDGEEVVRAAGVLGGRPAYVDEAAAVVGMVCGRESAWMTGSCVSATGGGVMTRS
jgi:NAD(P)-dependent dehydrogenase (short-subunit alcohol dehydrogenase family)